MKTLVIIGCGPKAVAIAAKAKVLKDLGFSVPKIVIIEKNQPGGNWNGKNGFTNGKLPLDGPPQKDIGYPYRSELSPEVDKKMLAYSWTSYLIETDQYVDWVDKGRLVPTHGEFAKYLLWVIKKAKIPVIKGEVYKITQNAGLWEVRYVAKKGKGKVKSDGLILTGPGDPYKLPVTGKITKANIYNGNTFWKNIQKFKDLSDAKIAVIGGGETAGSIVVGLLNTIDVDSSKIDIINGHAVVFTRNANYFDNNYFSDPSNWQMLSKEHRKELMSHIESGNFSAWSKNAIDTTYLDSWFSKHVVNMQLGKAEKIHVNDKQLSLVLNIYDTKKTVVYDYIIVALGSDSLSFKKLFKDKMLIGERAQVEENIAFDMSLGSLKPKLHLPMLAALNQGVGFALLGCLGLLSERILSSYVSYKMPITIQNAKEKGRGVYARRNISKGEIVVVGKPIKIVEKRTDYSFQTAFDTHTDLDEPARLINHSCSPNTGVWNNIFGGYNFVALKDIAGGEEITWDYETTEYTSISVKKCYCNSKNCRKKTKGFQYLPKSVIKKYGQFIGGYLKKEI